MALLLKAMVALDLPIVDSLFNLNKKTICENASEFETEKKMMIDGI